MHKATLDPAYRKRPAYHATLLAAIAMVTTALLAIGDLTTRDTIALRLAEDLKNSLAEVVPPSLHDNNLLDDTVLLKSQGSNLFHEPEVTIYRAQKNNEVVASAFEVIGKGYAGDILILIGINRDGELLGVRIIAHQETPGLGDKIERSKSNWVEGFKGKSFENTDDAEWAVRKDGGQFDQFSGATITPRGIVSAVKRGIEFYRLNRQNILAANNTNASTPRQSGESL
jgi:electron transport complex protein RnfG